MKKRRVHPCSRWCEQKLYSLVENLKLRGEVAQDFRVEFVPLKGLTWLPNGGIILKCPAHGRSWRVKQLN